MSKLPLQNEKPPISEPPNKKFKSSLFTLEDQDSLDFSLALGTDITDDLSLNNTFLAHSTLSSEQNQAIAELLDGTTDLEPHAFTLSTFTSLFTDLEELSLVNDNERKQFPNQPDRYSIHEHDLFEHLSLISEQVTTWTIFFPLIIEVNAHHALLQLTSHPNISIALLAANILIDIISNESDLQKPPENLPVVTPHRLLDGTQLPQLLQFAVTYPPPVSTATISSYLASDETDKPQFDAIDAFVSSWSLGPAWYVLIPLLQSRGFSSLFQLSLRLDENTNQEYATYTQSLLALCESILDFMPSLLPFLLFFNDMGLYLLLRSSFNSSALTPVRPKSNHLMAKYPLLTHVVQQQQQQHQQQQQQQPAQSRTFFMTPHQIHNDATTSGNGGGSAPKAELSHHLISQVEPFVDSLTDNRAYAIEILYMCCTISPSLCSVLLFAPPTAVFQLSAHPYGSLIHSKNGGFPALTSFSHHIDCNITSNDTNASFLDKLTLLDKSPHSGLHSVLPQTHPSNPLISSLGPDHASNSPVQSLFSPAAWAACPLSKFLSSFCFSSGTSALTTSSSSSSSQSISPVVIYLSSHPLLSGSPLLTTHLVSATPLSSIACFANILIAQLALLAQSFAHPSLSFQSNSQTQQQLLAKRLTRLISDGQGGAQREQIRRHLTFISPKLVLVPEKHEFSQNLVDIFSALLANTPDSAVLFPFLPAFVPPMHINTRGDKYNAVGSIDDTCALFGTKSSISGNPSFVGDSIPLTAFSAPLSPNPIPSVPVCSSISNLSASLTLLSKRCDTLDHFFNSSSAGHESSIGAILLQLRLHPRSLFSLCGGIGIIAALLRTEAAPFAISIAEAACDCDSNLPRGVTTTVDLLLQHFATTNNPTDNAATTSPNPLLFPISSYLTGLSMSSWNTIIDSLIFSRLHTTIMTFFTVLPLLDTSINDQITQPQLLSQTDHLTTLSKAVAAVKESDNMQILRVGGTASLQFWQKLFSLVRFFMQYSSKGHPLPFDLPWIDTTSSPRNLHQLSFSEQERFITESPHHSNIVPLYIVSTLCSQPLFLQTMMATPTTISGSLSFFSLLQFGAVHHSVIATIPTAQNAFGCASLDVLQTSLQALQRQSTVRCATRNQNAPEPTFPTTISFLLTDSEQSSKSPVHQIMSFFTSDKWSLLVQTCQRLSPLFEMSLATLTIADPNIANAYQYDKFFGYNDIYREKLLESSVMSQQDEDNMELDVDVIVTSQAPYSLIVHTIAGGEFSGESYPTSTLQKTINKTQSVLWSILSQFPPFIFPVQDDHINSNTSESSSNDNNELYTPLSLSATIHSPELFTTLFKLPPFRCILHLVTILALAQTHLLTYENNLFQKFLQNSSNQTQIEQKQYLTNKKISHTVPHAFSKLLNHIKCQPTIIRNILGEISYFAGETSPQGIITGQLMIVWETTCAVYHDKYDQDDQ